MIAPAISNNSIQVPRCSIFFAAKARLRGMLGRVTLLAADVTDYDSLPDEHRTPPYDVVLDSSMFHLLSDAERERYAASLARLLRIGGVFYLNAVSEEETRQGGPRQVLSGAVGCCRVTQPANFDTKISLNMYKSHKVLFNLAGMPSHRY